MAPELFRSTFRKICLASPSALEIFTFKYLANPFWSSSKLMTPSPLRSKVLKDRAISTSSLLSLTKLTIKISIPSWSALASRSWLTADVPYRSACFLGDKPQSFFHSSPISCSAVCPETKHLTSPGQLKAEPARPYSTSWWWEFLLLTILFSISCFWIEEVLP